MARQLRVEYQGAIYHVTCRMLGDAGSRLFIDDSDRERFLESLAERVEQYNIRLYMFVLMRNHFHLLFETPESNCSKFMHSLSTSYTVYYNLRHRRHGHLFDGRYKAKLVDGDEYLLALSRYIHLNPVKISTMKKRPLKERISHLRQYRWSSYQSYIGKRKGYEFMDYGPILSEMRGKAKDHPKRYREYVEAGVAQDDEEFISILKESPRSIGGDSFRSWIDELYQKLVEEHKRPEDVSFRRTIEPLEPGDVLEILADVLGVKVDEFRQRRRNSPLKAIAARFLLKYAGQTQREIADHLNTGSGAAISKQLSRYKEMLSKDRKWKKSINRCDNLLEERRAVRSGVVKS